MSLNLCILNQLLLIIKSNISSMYYSILDPLTLQPSPLFKEGEGEGVSYLGKTPFVDTLNIFLSLTISSTSISRFRNFGTVCFWRSLLERKRFYMPVRFRDQPPVCSTLHYKDLFTPGETILERYHGLEGQSMANSNGRMMNSRKLSQLFQ